MGVPGGGGGDVLNMVVFSQQPYCFANVVNHDDGFDQLKETLQQSSLWCTLTSHKAGGVHANWCLILLTHFKRIMLGFFRNFAEQIKALLEREEAAAEKLFGDFERLGFQSEDKQHIAELVTSIEGVIAKAVVTALVSSLKAISRSQRLFMGSGSTSRKFTADTNATHGAFKKATRTFTVRDTLYTVADTVRSVLEMSGKNPPLENIDALIDLLK